VMKPYTPCRLQGVFEKFLNSVGDKQNLVQPGNRIDASHSAPDRG